MDYKNEHKTLLILDIDETLIHARTSPLAWSEDFRIFHFYVYKRPYLSFFLNAIKNDFDIAVWSSASDDYVEEMVKHIFPENFNLKFVWGSSKCTCRSKRYEENFGRYLEDYQTPFFYLKSLQKLKRKGYKLDRILIIDDSPEKCMTNYGNAIYPEEFTGEQDDDELKYLAEYLLSLKDEKNVRTIEKRGWKSGVLLKHKNII